MTVMATEKPSKTEMKHHAKALAAQLRADLGITGPRSKVRHGSAWNVIAIRCVYPDSPWPYEVTTAMYGIDWARRSGRIDCWVEEYLRGLSDWQWCSLIADVAVSCRVSGEVPEYFVRRFPQPPR